jgi:hypothetical protein
LVILKTHAETNQIAENTINALESTVGETRDCGATLMSANDAGQWRADPDNQMQTDAQSARPLHQPC